MAIAVRRAFLILVVALALLVGLLGWAMHAATTAPVHAAGVYSTHQIADGPNYYCPPPPYDCW